MRKLVWVLALIIAGFQLKAQDVTIIDRTNLQPIENVVVYNLSEDASSLSNAKGRAGLEDFRPDDTLVFQHPTYAEKVLLRKDLPAMNFVVKLQEKSVNLSEVVISASKWEQDKKEVPNKISSVTKRQIDLYNPQSAADLLDISNEVFIQKSQYGGGSPMIRGFAANSVLLVVDGVRMNNAIFRSGNLQNVINIDPNTIESAEVIFGPGSIIYGSDALGGVMDFHTTDVQLAVNGKSYFETNSLLRYATASDEKTGHIDFSFGRKKWGSYTSFTFSDFGDLRMGDNYQPEYKRLHYAERINGQDSMLVNEEPNVQKFSGYEQLNILQKFRYRPGDNMNLVYSFNYSTTSNIPRYDRLIEYADDRLKYAQWYYGPQKWMMHNLTMNIFNAKGIYDNAKIVAAFQHFEESRHDRKFGKTTLRSRTEKVDALSLNLDFDKSLNENQTFFYGLEGIYNKVNSDGFEKDIESAKREPVSTRYPAGGSDYSTFAAYFSYKNNLGQKLTINTGARYSHVLLDADFADTVFFNFPFREIRLSTGALNGSLGAVYRPSQQWQYNLNLSSGFRAPNLDDVAKVFDSEPGNVIVPNKNLKPEYAYNADLGIIKRFGKQARMNLTVFYTYLNDAMARREFSFNGQDSIKYDGELSQVWAIVNVGSAQIYGGSFSFNWDVTSYLAFDTYLTLQKGEDADGLPVRHVPPMFGSTGLTLTREKLKIKLYTKYNGEISYENLARPEQSKPHLYAENEDGNPYSPAWWTLNLKTSYQINPYLQIDLGIENFFDYRYRPYSSGIAAPGRNLIVALRGTF